MAAFLDAVYFTPTAGGTTDWTVSAAVVGYNTPALGGAVNGETYKYRAESSDLSQWEIGEGTYNTGTGVLTRTTVLYNSAGTGTRPGQSGAGSKISFTNPPSVGVVSTNEDLGGVRGVRSVSGTSDTLLDGDLWKTVSYTNAGAVAVTLPQAGAAGKFLSSWTAFIKNAGGSATVVTVTPTTSTINGAASLAIKFGHTALVVADGSGNYIAYDIPNITALLAANNLSEVANAQSSRVNIGATTVYMQDTAPVSPSAGNLWWQSTNGTLYVYYSDGTSSQWVAASPVPALVAAVQYDAAQSLSTAQKKQAQLNLYVAPTLTVLTSGSGTYNLPTGCQWIDVEVQAGGGAGAGSGTTNGAGGTGGNSTFGTSLLTCNGGTGGSASDDGGPGGTATGGDINVPGATGSGNTAATGGSQPGGAGASSRLGNGGGGGGQSRSGSAGQGYGAGGGGAGGGGVGNIGPGGGSGGYARKLITAPLSAYNYVVGAAGTAGTAGTGGSAGGAGAPGVIIVTEHYGS